jgi:GntR family transcriptional regulator, transcriptional repressor for pyruvate dehydrogenase complex
MSEQNNHTFTKPFTTTTLVDQVEERIRDYFRERSLKVGDPIPKEIELTEALGVSRSVVREALSRLRMLGMVETRTRKGMVLSSPDIFNGFERVLDLHLLDDKTLQDLVELRLVHEIGMASFLFERKSEKDMHALEEIVNRETGTIDRAVKVECDIAFHAKLYQISGNHTLMKFQKLLWPLFDYVQKSYKIRIEAAIRHADLLEELKKGNPNSFREAMNEHLRIHFLNLFHNDNPNGK